MQTYLSCSSAETRDFGRRLAAKIANSKEQRAKGGAAVFALTGDLGSGKTTFARGFLRALGVRKKITSPTFVLVKRYAIGHMQYANCYHIDAYRLKKPTDLKILGFKEIITDPRSVVLVEWAEKVKKLLPKSTVWIKFSHGRKESERRIGI